MTIWVNGKIVIDTRKNGNVKYPARMTDFLVAAELKKGENIIAVRYVTGNGSARIALAGPMELKARSKKMRIVKTLCKDDFEADTAKSKLYASGSKFVQIYDNNLTLTSIPRYNFK